jgi:hypothetical protein
MGLNSDGAAIKVTIPIELPSGDSVEPVGVFTSAYMRPYDKRMVRETTGIVIQDSEYSIAPDPHKSAIHVSKLMEGSEIAFQKHLGTNSHQSSLVYREFDTQATSTKSKLNKLKEILLTEPYQTLVKLFHAIAKAEKDVAIAQENELLKKKQKIAVELRDANTALQKLVRSIRKGPKTQAEINIEKELRLLAKLRNDFKTADSYEIQQEIREEITDTHKKIQKLQKKQRKQDRAKEQEIERATVLVQSIKLKLAKAETEAEAAEVLVKKAELVLKTFKEEFKALKSRHKEIKGYTQLANNLGELVEALNIPLDLDERLEGSVKKLEGLISKVSTEFAAVDFSDLPESPTSLGVFKTTLTELSKDTKTMKGRSFEKYRAHNLMFYAHSEQGVINQLLDLTYFGYGPRFAEALTKSDMVEVSGIVLNIHTQRNMCKACSATVCRLVDPLFLDETGTRYHSMSLTRQLFNLFYGPALYGKVKLNPHFLLMAMGSYTKEWDPRPENSVGDTKLRNLMTSESFTSDPLDLEGAYESGDVVQTKIAVPLSSTV